MKKRIDQILEILKNIIKLIFFITVATLIGLLFRKWGFPDTTIILIYGLAVLIEAVFADGYFYGILCTLIIIIVYNFFFTTPTFSFQVSDPSYFVSMLILSIYSGIVSFLTYRAKFNAKKALEKESETRALYMLVSKLSVSDSIEDIIRNSSNIFSEIFSTKVEVESFNDSEEYKEFIDKNPQPYKSYYEDANNEVWIIYGKKQVVGTVKFPLRFSETLPLSKLRLLRTMIESLSISIEKFQASKEKALLEKETEKERYRNNLLRAISHDIRTPLTSIMGSSEILLDLVKEDESQRTLVSQIYDDSKWLHDMVENILRLTKLQNDVNPINLKIEAVEELMEAVYTHSMRELKDEQLVIKIPQDLVLVPMDIRLIEQVILNLIGNAIKNTDENRLIELEAKVDRSANKLIISAQDNGKGIKEDSLPFIFNAFYTTKPNGVDSNKDVGLGLAICKAIVKAHNGEIWAENTPGKGAKFSFTLPLEEEK